MEFILISIIYLLITAKTSFLHYFVTLFIPGFVLLALAGAAPKKRFIFSIPASILILHWPYFTLTRLGINIPSSIFYIVPAIMTAIYIYRFKDELSKLYDISKGIKFTGTIKKSTINIIIISLVSLMIFHHVFSVFLTEKAVPLTLGAKYVGETEILRDNIENGIGAVGWSDRWFGGMHTFISYPIISYLMIATDSMHQEAWQAHNVAVFLFTFLAGLYLYYFLKDIGAERKIALISSFIAVSLPAFVQVNNVAKTTIDLMFIVIFLHALKNITENPKKQDYLILTATFLAWSMNYYLSVYDLMIPTALFAILYYIISQEPVKSRIRNIKYIFASGITALALAAIWIIPYIVGFVSKSFSLTTYSEFRRYPLKDMTELLKWIANPIEYLPVDGNPYALKFEIYTFTTLTPIVFYAGLIAGILILIWSLRKKDKNLLYSVMSLSLLGFIALQLTPLRDMIPAYFGIYGQIYPYLPLAILFMINIALLMTLITGYAKRTQGKDISWLLVIVLIAALYPTINYSHNLGQFLRETSMSDSSGFSDIYRAVEYYGQDGRFVLFGIYGPGLMPAITKFTGIPSFSGYGYDSHTTLQQYEKRILPLQEGTMDNLLTDNPSYAYNIFSQSNVKVLIFNRCSPAGKKAWDILSNETRFTNIIESQCIVLLGIQDKTYTEKIALTEILVDNPEFDLESEVHEHGSHELLEKLLNNREKSINALLGVPAGERIHFTKDEFAFGKENYANIIINRTATKEEIEEYLKNNSTVIYFRSGIQIDNPNFHPYAEYPTDSETLDNILQDLYAINKPVSSKRNDNTWSFDEKGYILVRETFHEKWHSNADLKESYLGFMIADSKGNTEISIGNMRTEILGGIITIISYMTLIMIMRKRETEEEKQVVEDEEKDTKKRKKSRRK